MFNGSLVEDVRIELTINGVKDHRLTSWLILYFTAFLMRLFILA